MPVKTGIGVLLTVVAGSLGIMSFLHIDGVLGGGTPPFRASSAGYAEAIIGVVLLAAAIVIFRTPNTARPFAIGATVFSLIGFGVGITITISGGDAFDIAYHSTVLPFLIATLVLLVRTGTNSARVAVRE